MKSVYLASPFFSDKQKERIYQVKEALVKNKTIDSEKIFIPHEHEYQEAEFGSFEWQKATFQLDVSQISAADLVVAIVDYKMEETKENEPDSAPPSKSASHTALALRSPSFSSIRKKKSI